MSNNMQKLLNGCKTNMGLVPNRVTQLKMRYLVGCTPGCLAILKEMHDIGCGYSWIRVSTLGNFIPIFPPGKMFYVERH